MTGPRAGVRISVITPTHNRPDSLLRLLRVLRDGTFPTSDVEAVIVADGCSDDTVARARAEPLPFAVRVLEQNPGRGAAAARNLGATLAGGELLVFLDDDIEPSPALLTEHWREYMAATLPTAVIGPPRPVRQLNAGLHAIAAWAWWENQFALMQRPGHRFTYDNVFSGNLSVPRTLFASVAGFDVAFNSCRDDSEFGLRVLRHGARVAFAPAAWAWHHELRDPAALNRRKEAEGVADVRLARLYPELWPALQLALPDQRRSPVFGAVRRTAFGAPRLSRLAATALESLLPLLEAARMRGIWRRLHAGLMYYRYWVGVSQALGRFAAFETLRAECLARAAQARTADLAIDLAQGLEPALQAVDAAQAPGVTLRWGLLEIGRIAPHAGAEPVGSRHVRAALAGVLAQRLTRTLAVAASSGSPVLRHAAAPPVGGGISAYGDAAALGDSGDSLGHDTRAGGDTPPRSPVVLLNGAGCSSDNALRLPIRVLDVEIGGGIADIGDCAGYGGVRALVRRRGTPLGWINLPCPRGRIEAGDILAALRHQLAPAARRASAADIVNDPNDPGNGTAPPISVVVCTRDRPALLARCLQSLAQIDYPLYEVVVVDNASTSAETRDVAQSAGVRYLREDVPGLDHARNRGWTSARYAIVAFTDDDVEVDPGWLRGMAASFSDAAVQFVTGLVAPGRMDSEAEALFEMCYGGMGKGMRPRRWDAALLSSRELIGAHQVGAGANMAFRRALLHSLGGFDPALDVGTAAHGAGDIDIFHRALMRGAVGQYEPRALVRHHHRRDMPALRRQHYDNGRAFGVYLLGILKRGAIPRHETIWYALRVWLAWLVRRLLMRALRRDTLPSGLILAELRGAAHAPGAYLATYRQSGPLPHT